MTDQLSDSDDFAITNFAPCFPVTDMKASLAHYVGLGFEAMEYEDGMEWAWVRFGIAELHLFLKRDHDPSTTAAAADLVVADADALESAWSGTGISGTSNAYDTPYGMREAVHIDPDNNLIRFGTPLNKGSDVEGRI
jgi:catechol 2,3-dioxygenase-like lactoylglutathione lyase family enzyme